MKVRASGSDSLSFVIRSGVLQGCALSPTLLNYIINLKGYTRVQFGTNSHVFDLAYADFTVFSSSSYGMHINASKIKVMSTIIPGGQRQAVLLDGEPLEDVDKFRYLGSIFAANGQST